MKRVKYLLIIILPLILSFIIYSKIGGKRLKYTNSFLKEQSIFEEAFFDDASAYKFDDPKVILDPYNISPLTALVIFSTDNKEKVEVEVIGKDKDSTIYNSFKENNKHYIPIYGLYPNTTNTVKIRCSGQEKILYIKTGYIHLTMPNIKVKTNDYTLIIADNEIPYIYDHNGDIRWYLNKKVSNFYKRGFYLLSNLSNNEDNIYYHINYLGKVNEYVLDKKLISDLPILKLKKDKNYYAYNVRFYDDNYYLKKGYKVYGNLAETKVINKKINTMFVQKINYKDNLKYNGYSLMIKSDYDGYIILDRFFNHKVYKMSKGINYINSTNLKGTYKIYINYKNKTYSTGNTVNFMSTYK